MSNAREKRERSMLYIDFQKGTDRHFLALGHQKSTLFRTFAARMTTHKDLHI